MDIEIIRSDRRVKTVSGRLEGDKLIIRAPADLPEAELEKAIAAIQKRLLRRREGRRLSDEALQGRAEALNQRYFGGKLRWQRIAWVTNQEHRLGSCTPSHGTIRISHRVAGLPTWVQDYVIVHELAHLLEPNHGPRFWKLVSRYPLAERARGYLMALGLELPEDLPPSP